MIAALALLLVCAGYLWVGVVGTGSELAFLWPGVLAFAAAGVFGVFAKAGRRPAAPSAVCLAAAAAFVAYIGWRALASDVAYYGRIDLLLALPVLVLYGLFATVLGTSRLRLVFVSVLFLLLFGNVATAFYQKFGDELFSIIPGYSRNILGHHPSGFYNIHPHFAGFLEAVIPFAASLFLFGRAGVVARVACAAVALIGLAGLVLAMSRGGFLGTITGLAVVGGIFVYLAPRLHGEIYRRFRLLLWGGVAVALGLVVLVGALTIKQRFGGGIVDAEGKIQSGGRTAYWEAAWDQFGDAPLTGAGSKSFSYHFNKNFPEDFWVGTLTPTNVHNDYLQTLAEYGLIGGGLALFVIIAHLIRGVRFVRWSRNVRFERDGRRTSNELALAVGALGSASAFAVHSFFDFNMHLLANASLMGFVFAVLSSPGTRRERPAASAFFSRLAVPATAVCLLLLGVRHAVPDRQLQVGEHVHNGGDEATATAMMHQVVEADPENFRAQKNLALFRFKKTYDASIPEPATVGYVREALEGFKEALMLHPFDYFSLVYAGRCETYLAVYETDARKRAGRFEEAERWLAKAAEWAPLRHEPATWQGDLLRTQAYVAQIGGDQARALELAERSFERFSFAVSRTPMRMRGDTEQQYGKAEMKQMVAQIRKELPQSPR